MFKVYYGDGSVYEGEPQVAPRLNVQMLLCDDTSQSVYQVKVLALHGWDYYLLRSDGSWYGINGEADLVDHVLHECPRVVLKGRLIENSAYQSIISEAAQFKRNWNRIVEDGRYPSEGIT